MERLIFSGNWRLELGSRSWEFEVRFAGNIIANNRNGKDCQKDVEIIREADTNKCYLKAILISNYSTFKIILSTLDVLFDSYFYSKFQCIKSEYLYIIIISHILTTLNIRQILFFCESSSIGNIFFFENFARRASAISEKLSLSLSLSHVH